MEDGDPQVAGVAVPAQVTVAGTPLRLNGAGVRRKFIFDAYVVALYLPTRMRDAAEVIASESPKAVRLVFLWEVTADDVIEEITDGIERNNTQAQVRALRPALKQLRAVLPNVKRGQLLSFLYQPGIGTRAGVEGAGSVTIVGKAFSDALLRSMLGREPLDADLKEKLLGR